MTLGNYQTNRKTTSESTSLGTLAILYQSRDYQDEELRANQRINQQLTSN